MPAIGPPQGCIQLGVEQVFQPAGEGDFLVALPRVSRGGRNWKVPSTRRLESPRYVAELDAALLDEDGMRGPTRRPATVLSSGWWIS